MKRHLGSTELILNSDGSIYHLKLHPGELADTILLVGDPSRAAIVSSHFDRIDVIRSNREFVTHTGVVGSMPISVIATGIGACNIDIVLNEIDALMHVDFATREYKSEIKSPRLIRLGTCGSLRSEIPVDSLILSSYAFGFDGLLNFYHQQLSEEEKGLLEAVHISFGVLPMVDNTYVAAGSAQLRQLFHQHCFHGITMTCSGFYGPQHRHMRLPLIEENIFELARKLQYRKEVVTNLEMETAAIYGLGKLFGYECCSISAVIGNRIHQTTSKQPQKTIEHMIDTVLDLIT